MFLIDPKSPYPRHTSHLQCPVFLIDPIILFWNAYHSFSIQCFTSMQYLLSETLHTSSVQCFTSMQHSLSETHFTGPVPSVSLGPMILVQDMSHFLYPVFHNDPKSLSETHFTPPVFSVSRRTDICSEHISHLEYPVFHIDPKSLSEAHFSPPLSCFYIDVKILIQDTLHTSSALCHIDAEIIIRDTLCSSGGQCSASFRLSLSKTQFTLTVISVSLRPTNPWSNPRWEHASIVSVQCSMSIKILTWDTFYIFDGLCFTSIYE